MMVKDPVCGMQVDEQMAMATSVYQGQTYYFCAKACQATFERQPEQYVGGGSQTRERLRIVQSEPSRTREMPSRWRKVLLGAAALGGIGLISLGISGLALIIWCLVAGVAWAGLKGRR